MTRLAVHWRPALPSSKSLGLLASGVSLPSAEASVTVSASSGAVTVTQPTVPTNGASCYCWQIYSSGTTGTELLNTVAASSTPSPVVIPTTEGSETGYLIATTSLS